MKFINDNNEEITLLEGESLFVTPNGVVKIITDGRYGVLLDEPTQDVLDFIKYACEKYNYLPMIPNPDFDPDIEVSDIPQFISNPISPDVFARNILRKFAANIVNEGTENDAIKIALQNKPEVDIVIID